MAPAFVIVHPRNVPVDRPMAVAAMAEPKANREDAITVAVSREGSVFFRSNKIEFEDLPRYFREAVKAGKEAKVYLAADARANTGTLRQWSRKFGRRGLRT